MNKLLKVMAILFIVCTHLQAANFRTGAYSMTLAGTKWLLKFDDNGRITVSSNGQVAVEGTYQVTGDEIAITDGKGPIACPEGQRTGKYAWRLGQKSLTLSKVEDLCQGRINTLASQTWVRE